ncbi:unnamed protein product, partial [Sphenostylis stenocarpa]
MPIKINIKSLNVQHSILSSHHLLQPYSSPPFPIPSHSPTRRTLSFSLHFASPHFLAQPAHPTTVLCALTHFFSIPSQTPLPDSSSYILASPNFTFGQAASVSTHDHLRLMNFWCRALRLGHCVVPPPSPHLARLTRDPLHREPLHYLDGLLPNPLIDIFLLILLCLAYIENGFGRARWSDGLNVEQAK